MHTTFPRPLQRFPGYLRLSIGILLLGALLTGLLPLGQVHAAQRQSSAVGKGAQAWRLLSPDNCLKAAITPSNPSPQRITIVMGFSNLCTADVTHVVWSYTTTVLCNGFYGDGPANSGIYAYAGQGTFQTVTKDTHAWQCPNTETGDPVSFEVSFTGTTSGYLAGSTTPVGGAVTTANETFI